MRSAVLVFVALAIAMPASAATFKGEAHDHTVTVFSSSKAYEHCKISQPFSFVNEGARTTTAITCNVNVVPGNHRQVCEVTHDIMVEPKLEGPVQVTQCDPSVAPDAPKKRQ